MLTPRPADEADGDLTAAVETASLPADLNLREAGAAPVMVGVTAVPPAVADALPGDGPLTGSIDVEERSLARRLAWLMARLRSWFEPSLPSLVAVRAALPRMPRTATFALAAALGGAAGSLVTTGLVHLASARDDALVVEALQGTIAVLATEVRTLRAAVAAGTATAAAADVSPETTGSIAPVGIAVPGWSVARVENGRALIRGNGTYYEVMPGSTLPGLGAVRAIGRADGRWIVTTDAGFIASPG